MSIPGLVAYADLESDPLIRACQADPVVTARILFTERGGLTQAVAERVAASRGPFAVASRDGRLDPARLAIAANDLTDLSRLAFAAASPAGLVSLPDAPHTGIVRLLVENADWAVHAATLADYYRSNGVGPLATHRVLRFTGHELVGVTRPDPIGVQDLIGGDQLRAALHDDLAAFVAGGRANDALLYGPPGTGKSATVRALAASFADQGLRLVQIARDELDRIDAAFDALAGAGPRCLVFLDDVVFDDTARADRVLRAAIEGGVVARPANILVWATSNRLNLTHQTHSERADELDEQEARGEKTALANRFGRRVRFAVTGESWYLQIVSALLAADGRVAPAEAVDAALRFARTGAGPTPRTAHQFVASGRPPR
jgi:uncharacterized protein